MSQELEAVGLDGKDRDISLGGFADDVFRKVVWDGHDEEEGVRRVLDVSDQALDEALTSGGWVKNESKREQVLDIRRKGLARKMQDGQLRGRIVASAVWGTMLRESPMDSVDHLKPDAHRYARMSSLARRPFLRSGKVTGERCSKLAIQLLDSVNWRSG